MVNLPKLDLLSECLTDSCDPFELVVRFIEETTGDMSCFFLDRTFKPPDLAAHHSPRSLARHRAGDAASAPLHSKALIERQRTEK
jgi:hypothetical protein